MPASGVVQLNRLTAAFLITLDRGGSGRAAGSGTTLGTYTVTVTATDTAGVSGTATFVWSVVQ